MGTKQGQFSLIFRRAKRFCAWTIASVGLTVGLVFAILHLASPIITAQKPHIEEWLTEEIGHQVQFKTIEIGWSLWMPAVVLKELSLQATGQKEHWLEVDRLQFSLDWWQSLAKRKVTVGHWRMLGVDCDLEQITPADHEADVDSLLATFDHWLTKNPTRIKQLTLHLPEIWGLTSDIIFDEIFLHKETGLVSPLNKPPLRPWLNTTEKNDVPARSDVPAGVLKQRLTINGRVHLQGQPKRKLSFVAETRPYQAGEAITDAKIYLDSQQFPLQLLPMRLGHFDKQLAQQILTGKVWVDVQKGSVAAVQATVHALEPLNKTKNAGPSRYAGHLYAMKDHQAGWWITADSVQIFSSKQPVITGKFALSYRDIDNGEVDWLVRLPHFSFTQGKTTLSGEMQWRQAAAKKKIDGFSVLDHSYLELSADIKHLSHEQFKKHLADAAASTALNRWLQQSLQAAVLQSAHLDLVGKLGDLKKGSQYAKIAATGVFSNLDLHFHPEWPSVQTQQVEFNLQQDSLAIIGKNNTFVQAPVKLISAQVHSLFDHDQAKVDLHSPSPGAWQQAQSVSRQTPLQTTLGKRFAMVRLQGAADLNVRIGIPLQPQPAGTKKPVTGQLTLLQSTLKLSDWPVVINDLTGSVHFTEKYLQASSLLGKLWQEKIALQLTTKDLPPATPMKVVARGRYATTGATPLTQVLQRFPVSGSALVESVILLPENNKDAIHLELKSNLQGLQISLPQPLGKSSAESTPTTAHVELQPISKNYRYQIEYDDKKVLIEYHRQSDNAHIWNMNFNDPNLFGEATLSMGSSTSVFKGHLARLYLNHTQPTYGQNVFSIQPASLPNVDILVEDFQLDKRQLGQLTLATRANVDGQDISKLTLQAKAFTLQAQGKWQRVNQQQHTTLSGSFTSKDLNKALKNLNMKPTLESDKTQIQFNFDWPDTPYRFHMKLLNGSGVFRISDGRVLQLSKHTSQMIGISRLLNMLSVHSIPKRLRLDFSDLTQKGLHFDKFKGTVTIQNGNATTQDAELEGPVAKIRWRGRVGLAHRDYDLIMQVEPHVTSSLPVVAAIAGGPIVGPVAGIAAWMVNKTIAPGFEKFSAYTYQVRGAWEHPNVQSITNPQVVKKKP